jgi:hypothetical protein
MILSLVLSWTTSKVWITDSSISKLLFQVFQKQQSMTICNSHPFTASYADSGFGRRIGWGKRPALLLIDVCVAYWTSGSPLDLSANPEAAKVPQSMRKLLIAARKAGVPVLWTAVEYAQNGEMRDAGLFWQKNKVLDVWKIGDERKLHEWVEGLEPANNEP